MDSMIVETGSKLTPPLEYYSMEAPASSYKMDSYDPYYRYPHTAESAPVSSSFTGSSYWPSEPNPYMYPAGPMSPPGSNSSFSHFHPHEFPPPPFYVDPLPPPPYLDPIVDYGHHHQMPHHPSGPPLTPSLPPLSTSSLPINTQSNNQSGESSTITDSDNILQPENGNCENESRGLRGMKTIKIPATNKKERRRTLSINTAFSSLRKCIPNVPVDTKLSKIKTLRLASSYIKYLMDLMEDADDTLGVEGFKVDLQRFKRSRSTAAAVAASIASMGQTSSNSPHSSNESRSSGSGIKHTKMGPSSRSRLHRMGPGSGQRGRTGWPEHVWHQELKQEPSMMHPLDPNTPTACSSSSYLPHPPNPHHHPHHLSHQHHPSFIKSEMVFN